MTEFELLQLVANWSELTNLSEATFLTLLFAYLAAAHLVGGKLSRTQFAIVTLIYSVAILRTVRENYLQMSRLIDFGEQLNEIGSSYTVGVPSIAPYLISTIWVVGFGASLLYMYTCRKSP